MAKVTVWVEDKGELTNENQFTFSNASDIESTDKGINILYRIGGEMKKMYFPHRLILRVLSEER